MRVRAELPVTARGNVLVCTGHFYPHVGGVERYSIELWSRIVQRGFRVSLLTSNTHGVLAEEEVRGLQVFRMPVFKVIDGRLPVLLPSPTLLRTVDRLRRWRPDVIVTNTRFFSSSLLGIVLAQRWDVPSLHIDHASSHVSVGFRIGDAISEGIDHTFGAWVVRNCTRCVGVSRSVADFMGHFGRPDAGVIYNGVDTSRFAAPASPWRERLGLSADECMILYVGRLLEEKGALELERAFRALPPEPRARLVIAGDGPIMPLLRARAQSDARIHLLGAVSSDDVPGLLHAADLFVHPSAYPEGLPTAVLEAAAAGKAIVATPMGGTEEVVVPDATGIIVPPRDTQALADAISRLVQQPALRSRLGSAAAARCAALFDWERVADTAEDELRHLIERT